MPKTVSNLFTNLFSSKSKSTNNNNGGKLVTDAAPLDNQYNNQQMTKNDDNSSSGNSQTNNQTGLMLPNNESSLYNNSELDNKLIVAPVNNRELVQSSSAGGIGGGGGGGGGQLVLPENGNINNTLAVNQTHGYNVYQFSQISGLHIGSVFNIKNTNPGGNVDNRPRSGEPIRKTKSIDALMKSTESLTHKTMDLVSTHLGEGWRNLMRLLGFSEGQIEQMLEDNYIKGVKEVIYQLLLDYSRNVDDASVGHLTRLMWKSGHRECVYILKEHWKNSSKFCNTNPEDDDILDNNLDDQTSL